MRGLGLDRGAEDSEGRGVYSESSVLVRGKMRGMRCTMKKNGPMWSRPPKKRLSHFNLSSQQLW